MSNLITTALMVKRVFSMQLKSIQKFINFIFMLTHTEPLKRFNQKIIEYSKSKQMHNKVMSTLIECKYDP
ncbi:hypothetical protein BTN50_1437 [Candidatus Enterovibrio altilux]|uniref:Mobile element protein n=1 Tax=Candidatus Enterovibrio altilux TaxID=1927128 RepID=A0A291BA99_9GAMM|nr:hypothetical protein BTN50_1437 [Candidatus Enterovibrio luxaltus]